MLSTSIRKLAVAGAIAWLSVINVAQAQMTPFPVSGRIIFNRWAFTFNPQFAYNRMWRIDANGTNILALSPAIDDTRYVEADWSPSGQR